MDEFCPFIYRNIQNQTLLSGDRRAVLYIVCSLISTSKRLSHAHYFKPALHCRPGDWQQCSESSQVVPILSISYSVRSPSRPVSTYRACAPLLNNGQPHFCIVGSITRNKPAWTFREVRHHELRRCGVRRARVFCQLWYYISTVLVMNKERYEAV